MDKLSFHKGHKYGLVAGYPVLKPSFYHKNVKGKQAWLPSDQQERDCQSDRLKRLKRCERKSIRALVKRDTLNKIKEFENE